MIRLVALSQAADRLDTEMVFRLRRQAKNGADLAMQSCPGAPSLES